MTKTCKTTSKLGKDENGREYGSKECLELNGWSNCVKKERAFNDGGFEFEMQNREQFQHFEGIGERKRRALGKSGTWFLQTLFAVLALTSLTGNAINPGCRCIRFAATFGKEWGEFSSPDFPGEYQRGIPCLLYLFSAPVDFIVQLNFSHIRLPAANSNGCHSGDYLKLFLHLETEGVNESTPWNSLICGERSNQTYFSASRHLVIQFHAGSALVSPSQTGLSAKSSTTSGPLGFHGFFRFLNSSQFESNGVKRSQRCDYRFESRNYSSQGKFFSPYYPSNYPHNVMCTYVFHARLHERVKVVFESVALEPAVYSEDPPCSDIIRVFDGPTSRSPVIALICNTMSEYEILSTGQELLVEFIGNSGNELPGKGFRAKFHFHKVIYDDPYDPMRFNLQQYFPKLNIPKPVGEDGQPQASTLVPQCDQAITSDSGTNGTFSTPSYPNPYQPKSHCRFDFIGHGRQRVQISFVDFHLFHTDDKLIIQRPHSRNASGYGDNDSKCAFSDTVAVFIYINGLKQRLLEHCGLNPPLDLMSNDHRMTLEFNAKASTATPPFRGFYAHYSFLEDFGMKSGLQASDYPCAFIFNISSYPNGTGTISSPNSPGTYPRRTECHYFFHGNDEKGAVELSFDYFDVAGIYPCDEWDDYLEFSNFMPTDSRFGRRCGQIPNLQISGGGSPTKFFRVTFRSNDGWADGGTGFRAKFTFTRQINHVTSSTSGGSSNGGKSRNVIFSSSSLSDTRTQLLLFLLGTKMWIQISG